MAKNDEIIDKLLKTVEEKKKSIEKIKNPDFKTNLSFPMDIFGASSRVNLNVVSVDILYSILVHLEQIITKAPEIEDNYGISAPKEYAGYDWKLWREDIILKIKQKQVQNDVRELKIIEDKLNALMSEDRKKAKELDDIKKSLGL